MISEEKIEEGFQRIERIRFFEKQRVNIGSREFWLALNPEFSISDTPEKANLLSALANNQTVEEWSIRLKGEGYFQTPPLLPAQACERLAGGISRVVRAGFPAMFACVYDEFYSAFLGFSRFLAPVLGADSLLLPHGIWGGLVDTDDSSAGLPPHRDSPGPDPCIREGGEPSLLTVWLAITTATPLNGCMYGLPAKSDPCYRECPADGGAGHEVDLQKVRALPVEAGSFLCWTSHFLHWGGQSSSYASEPRISGAVSFQRRDVPPYDEPALEPEASLPFQHRLSWIAASLNDPELFQLRSE